VNRLDNWQSALSDYLTGAAAMPFAYGQLDCGLFVAGAIEAMTGVDVVPGIRRRYRTRAEAFLIVRQLGGAASMERLAEALTRRYDLPEVAPAAAQRGDVVLMGRGRSSSLALVAMHGTELLKPGAAGILRIPLSYATRAWRV
jgi:hypothetical protein